MTGLWSDIQNVKSVHCEPRKSDQEDFDEVIKNFYIAIRLSGMIYLFIIYNL
jgi:hypothetical protein